MMNIKTLSNYTTFRPNSGCYKYRYLTLVKYATPSYIAIVKYMLLLVINISENNAKFPKYKICVLMNIEQILQHFLDFFSLFTIQTNSLYNEVIQLGSVVYLHINNSASPRCL